MKLLIKTVLIFALTGAIILVFLLPGLLAFFFSFLGLRKPLQLGAYKMAQFWARLLIFFTGCSMTVTGRENIPPEGGVCFVSNHVGIFDIILALAYVGRPFGFIAKKELILIPGLDVWIFMLGGLFLDRKKPRSAIRTIKLGIKRIKAGGGILIFPEGTRSRGRGIAPFRSGSLRLATQSDSVIVPVALTGSYDVFEKSHRICAVPVSISFLPPIQPSSLPREARKQILADQIHDSIAAELCRHGALRDSAGPAGAGLEKQDIKRAKEMAKEI